jgi:ATP/maltotriose-dependent transcriptional regulator MalT
MAAALLMLAETDLLAGDRALAARRARESLSLYTELGDDRSRARCLVVLAATAVAEGDYRAAARALGTAEAARGDEAPDEYEEPLLARFLPELEDRLGADTLATLVAEGRGLDQQALAIASMETQA